MNTFSAKPRDLAHQWHLIDAADVPLAVSRPCRAAHSGQAQADFTPHMDGGDFVIVINAEKVKLTGRKLEQKRHSRHTGYMGHERFTPVKKLIEGGRPERVIEHAVFGMLPKNRLGRTLRSKLKVYRGPTHPHAAQKPEPLTVRT
jgi:large subunit ribosomal protein L13